MQIQQTMIQGYDLLSKTFLSYPNEQLAEIKTAYWGISYSRFEWLLEIVTHFYHHRGQVHILLCEHIKILTYLYFNKGMLDDMKLL